MLTSDLVAKSEEFWYVFDKRYTSGDVTQMYLNCNLYRPNPNPNGNPIFNFDWMFNSLKEKIRIDPLNYEQLFLIDVTRYKEGIKVLANDQKEIIYKYFSDIDEFRQAMELFGRGILYDERRKNVHQMQGRFPRDLVGYKRWHGFAHAAVSLGEDIDFWLNLDRSILLGYLIQSELKPLDSNPNNPPMDEQRLSEYRDSCMSLEIQSIDESFNYFFP
ncbi:MAG TPA: hypothetical protein VFT71_05725 [Candidatus Nitrosocosmicus sp.]|nr:hypothetical protein [Candidatus Nitrosocosmicus sp.]